MRFRSREPDQAGDPAIADVESPIVGDELSAGSPSPSGVSRVLGRVPITALLIVVIAVFAIATRPWDSVKAVDPNPVPTPNLLVDPAPSVGNCYTYTFFDFAQATETSPQVSCADPRHVAYTVTVIRAPKVSLPYDFDNAAANASVAACQPPVDQLTGIGDGVEFSSILGAVYEPTSLQLRDGQRWLRCDVVERGPKGSLRPLPMRLDQSLASGPNVRDALCVHPGPWVPGMHGDPSIMGWSNLADCSDPDAVVAIRSAHLGLDATTWPGATRVNRAADRACRTESSRFVGLALSPLTAPQDSWTPETLCVAEMTDYRKWVAKGKSLAIRRVNR